MGALSVVSKSYWKLLFSVLAQCEFHSRLKPSFPFGIVSVRDEDFESWPAFSTLYQYFALGGRCWSQGRTRDKALTNIREAIGLALGVVGPESNFDPATYVAELRSAEAMGPAQVRLKFGKARGHIDTVKAQMRRGSGAWTTVGMAVRSPWTELTPLAQPGVPETREFCVRAVVADEEIGQLSAAISVTGQSLKKRRQRRC